MVAGDIAPSVGLVPNMGYRYDDDKYIIGMAEVVDSMHSFNYLVCKNFLNRREGWDTVIGAGHFPSSVQKLGFFCG
jgi:hypothetical protein